MNTGGAGHSEIVEMMAAYAAGGLDGEERARVESHVAGCAGCAAAMDEAVRADGEMAGLFADARPAAGFEDRMVQGLRKRRESRWIMLHPAVRRAVSGLAAALVLGTVGYAATNLIESNRLPGAGTVAVRGMRALDERGEWTSTMSLPAYMNSGGDVDLGKTAGEAMKRRVEPTGVQNLTSYATGVKQSAKLALGKPVAEVSHGTQLGNDMKAGDAPGRVESGSERAEERGKRADSYNVLDAGGTVSGGYVIVAARQDLLATGNAVGAHMLNGVMDLYDTNGDTAVLRSEMRDRTSPTSGSGVSGMGVVQGIQAGVDVRLAPTALGQPVYFRPAEVVGRTRENAFGGGQEAPEKASAGADASPGGGGRGAVEERLGESRVGVTSNGARGALDPTVTPAVQAQMVNRKIIRNGDVEFEVESFDTSYLQVSKIVVEEGGFVSSTNSEKLANGKVRGTVVVRVPPERLDTLMLKLRALGDLKTQKIAAQDVTKMYYDLESQLKAARAMQERLLNIIKSGKGEIKDLVEAEKQLGVYLEKIEKLEGEIRYYNNLVSLSTLSVTLCEKDIKTPAFASQTEQVSMGIETEDVEKVRNDAIKAIEEAKGRVIESNLKKHDAGQLAATIVCEVLPEASGPLIDRMKQLGRVARLDVDRKTTTASGSGAPASGRVEKKDTRFSISIYNLANIAPRQTTAMGLAVSEVEEAYKAILETVKGKSGRIVTSSVNRQKPEQTTGTISFEVAATDADAVLAEIRRGRDVMSMTVTENPDTANVTASKRGFNLSIVSLATVGPRETEQQDLVAKGKVGDAYKAIVEALQKAGARITVSQLNQQDASSVNGQLDFEVLRAQELEVRGAMGAAADMLSRSVARSSDAENTVDSKVRITVRLMSIDRVMPRETFTLGMAAKEVPTAYRGLLSALVEQGCRVMQSQLNEQDRQNISGVLDFEVTREKREAVDKALAAAGVVYSRSVAKAPEGRNSVDTKSRMIVTMMSMERIQPRETTAMRLEVSDIEKATSEAVKAADDAGGRVTEATESKASSGAMSSHMVVDVPLSKAEAVGKQLKGLGSVDMIESAKNPQSPDGEIGRARFDVTLVTPDVTRSMGYAVSSGLAVAGRGLLWSLMLVVVGLCFVLPLGAVIWGGWKGARRWKARGTAAA